MKTIAVKFQQKADGEIIDLFLADAGVVIAPQYFEGAGWNPTNFAVDARKRALLLDLLTAKPLLVEWGDYLLDSLLREMEEDVLNAY